MEWGSLGLAYVEIPEHYITQMYDLLLEAFHGLKLFTIDAGESYVMGNHRFLVVSPNFEKFDNNNPNLPEYDLVIYEDEGELVEAVLKPIEIITGGR